MLEKIAEILTIARKPVLAFDLVKACSLSTLTFNMYVTQLLIPCGLLDAYPAEQGISGRPTRHRMVYQTSQKGGEFLKLYSEIEKLMVPYSLFF